MFLHYSDMVLSESQHLYPHLLIYLHLEEQHLSQHIQVKYNWCHTISRLTRHVTVGAKVPDLLAGAQVSMTDKYRNYSFI